MCSYPLHDLLLLLATSTPYTPALAALHTSTWLRRLLASGSSSSSLHTCTQPLSRSQAPGSCRCPVRWPRPAAASCAPAGSGRGRTGRPPRARRSSCQHVHRGSDSRQAGVSEGRRSAAVSEWVGGEWVVGGIVVVLTCSRWRRWGRTRGCAWARRRGSGRTRSPPPAAGWRSTRWRRARAAGPAAA